MDYGKVSMRTEWILAIAALCIFIFNHDVMAGNRSLRCAGELVNIGDFQHEVVAKCGDPQSVENFEDYPGEWVAKYYEDDQGRPKAPYLLKSPINREIWTYQLGPNHLPYDLYFYKGRLTRIEVGRRL
jgi:hypothetical protein